MTNNNIELVVNEQPRPSSKQVLIDAKESKVNRNKFSGGRKRQRGGDNNQITVEGSEIDRTANMSDSTADSVSILANLKSQTSADNLGAKSAEKSNSDQTGGKTKRKKTRRRKSRGRKTRGRRTKRNRVSRKRRARR